MFLILQLWGGGFYLINKILFAISESKQPSLKKQLKIISWIIYILGVPAWVIILVGHQNWIAASIETGGIPAMFLGLYNTWHDHKKPNVLFNRIVSLSTYSSLAFGLIYSFYLHGGISSIGQVLEVGVMLGFLLGSYYMAKNSLQGWLFFMLMNLSMASLMFTQDKPILMAQQLISLCFVVYGFLAQRKSKIKNKIR
ncbi:MAG: nicotinamide mononucleotide transporter [Akkermansiaceae bacterium]